MEKTNSALGFKVFILKLLELYRKESASRDYNPYRIIEIIERNSTVSFQITGTNVVLSVSAVELMRSEFLLGFSKSNIVLITHIGTKKELNHQLEVTSKNVFRIIKHIFTFGKNKFLIEDDEGESFELEAAEIFYDKNIAGKFSGIDGMNIGYSAAEDHYNKIIKLKGIDNEG